jgi:hypothetical protein
MVHGKPLPEVAIKLFAFECHTNPVRDCVTWEIRDLGSDKKKRNK